MPFRISAALLGDLSLAVKLFLDFYILRGQRSRKLQVVQCARGSRYPNIQVTEHMNSREEDEESPILPKLQYGYETDLCMLLDKGGLLKR